MADKRMFSKKIIDSDAFLDMPISARLLYYDLSMRADDDGFVNSPKKIMRIVGATQDDMNILCMRKFIIPFECGIVVIKHWKIHNYIAKDRYTETTYKEAKATLMLDENNAYTQVVDALYTECIQGVDEMDTQDRIGKDSIEEDSIEEDSIEEDSIETIKRIVSYLNMVCGTNYRYQTANTQKHIRARLNEGFTYEEFQTVIDKKSKEWLKSPMEKYLRPDTLFGSKFESYLNQNIVEDKRSNNNAGSIDWSKV